MMRGVLYCNRRTDEWNVLLFFTAAPLLLPCRSAPLDQTICPKKSRLFGLGLNCSSLTEQRSTMQSWRVWTVLVAYSLNQTEIVLIVHKRGFFLQAQFFFLSCTGCSVLLFTDLRLLWRSSLEPLQVARLLDDCYCLDVESAAQTGGRRTVSCFSAARVGWKGSLILSSPYIGLTGMEMAFTKNPISRNVLFLSRTVPDEG